MDVYSVRSYGMFVWVFFFFLGGGGPMSWQFLSFLLSSAMRSLTVIVLVALSYCTVSGSRTMSC